MNLTTLIGFLTAAVTVPADTAFDNNMIQMFLHSDFVIKIDLLVLVLFSVISWAIIFVKWRYFRKARHETAYFLDTFWGGSELTVIQQESKDLLFSPVAQLFKVGYAEFVRASKMHGSTPGTDKRQGLNGISDSVERALNRTIIDQGSRMEKTLPFLATTGTTAPLMGLFGTVWGIMESFRGIALQGSASLAVVAPGIAEALVTTAVGLIAAIPAYIAYNHFSSRAYDLRVEMDTFASDFLSLIVRHSYMRNIDKETEK